MIRSWLRILVVVVGGIETAAFLGFAALMLQSSDPLGKAMAVVNRWLALALALSVLAIPVAAHLWSRA